MPSTDAVRSGFSKVPFPRLVIDNFVPAETYRQLVASFPSADLFIHHRTGKLILTDEYDECRHTFWDFINSTTVWKIFLESIRSESFVDRMHLMFPVFSWSEVHAVRFHFSRLRAGGGEVPPHIDMPKKIVPIVLYMPMPEWRASNSGALEMLTFKQGMERQLDSYAKVDWASVETLAAPQFVGNRAAVMLKGDNSLHGVRPIPMDAGADRTSVTITLSCK